MMFIIHYHQDSGRISAWGNGDSEHSHFADHELLRLDDEVPLDPHRQKIDVATLAIVDKPAAERIDEMRLPIVNAIANELDATDRFMVPDRPLSEAQRQAWKHYRAGLRGLAGDVEAIVMAWPPRPDGGDAAADFRAQLQEIKS